MIHGTNVKIYMNDMCIAMCKECSINITHELQEVAPRENYSYKSFTPSRSSWNMSASGIVSYSAQLLPFIFANNKLVEVRYTDGGIEFKGNAYINQLKTSGRRGSIETYSVEFRGTGLLTSQFTDLKNSITTNLPFKWSTTSHYFGTIRVDNVRGIIFDKPISVNIPNLIPDVPNYPIDTKPYGDGMAIFDFVVEDHPISLPYSGVLNVVSTTNGLIVHYGTF